MKKGIVIAGFAGIGKTALAKKYSNVIDLESSKYKYDYQNVESDKYEQLKGNKNRKPNKNYPQNYIDAILDAVTKYDVVLVWQHPEIIEEYKKHGIEYILCYPSRKAFKNYPSNFESRGNEPQFIESLTNVYENRVEEYENLSQPKIVLDENEFIEDRLLKMGFDLIVKENYKK